MAKGDTTAGSGYFPGIYNSALQQTGEDYDSLMSQYKGLTESPSARTTSSLSYSPISPAFANYTPGSDFSELRGLASSGGLSSGDIGEIRARDAAPIRSIYSSAQRELARRTNLQGGYSPNAGAVTAKMSRELADALGDRASASNANIAELTSRNKLAAATSLAPLEAQTNALMNRMNEINAGATNRANEFNSQMSLAYDQNRQREEDSDFDKILRGIQGQQSTYGTTPALANTFGSQVLNAANMTGGTPSGSLAKPKLAGDRANNPLYGTLDRPTFNAHMVRSSF